MEYQKDIIKNNLNKIENYVKNCVDEETYTDPNLF